MITWHSRNRLFYAWYTFYKSFSRTLRDLIILIRFAFIPGTILKFTPTRASAAFAIVLEENGRDTYLVNAHGGVRAEETNTKGISHEWSGEKRKGWAPRCRIVPIFLRPVEVQKVAPPSPRMRPLRATRNPLVLDFFLPRARPRGPSGPPPRVPIRFPLPDRFARLYTHTGARAHSRAHEYWVHIYRYRHRHKHKHTHTQGKRFSAPFRLCLARAPRWKINIGKPGSSGRASTATSVQAPSRYHPYSPSRSLVVYPFFPLLH